jgi:hypothetical protein
MADLSPLRRRMIEDMTVRNLSPATQRSYISAVSKLSRYSGAARSLDAQRFTEKQGQYLAFIYTYSHMFRRPPAETDMRRHQMIVTLERNGLIRRQPGVARSIEILVAPQDIPILDWLKIDQS